MRRRCIVCEAGCEENTLFCSACAWPSSCWLAGQIDRSTPPDEILCALACLSMNGTPRSGKATLPSFLALLAGTS
jgi:hypothetical protein